MRKEETKICRVCKKLLSIDNFTPSARMRKSTRCNSCWNIYKASLSCSKTPREIKSCCLCKENKSISDFYKVKFNPDGYDVRCKICERARKRDYHARNRQKLNEKCRVWQKDNRDSLNDIFRNNPQKNLKRRIRCRVWHALKKQVGLKNQHTIELLGCSFDFLKKYLKDKFYDRYHYELNWEEFCNSGKYQLDHIIPCEAFDLTIQEGQLKCFNYGNLEILTYQDNQLKSDFLPSGKRARYLIQKLDLSVI